MKHVRAGEEFNVQLDIVQEMVENLTKVVRQEPKGVIKIVDEKTTKFDYGVIPV